MIFLFGNEIFQYSLHAPILALSRKNCNIAGNMRRNGDSVKNRIFHMRDLCLRVLDTNSGCAKSVRGNED